MVPIHLVKKHFTDAEMEAMAGTWTTAVDPTTWTVLSEDPVFTDVIHVLREDDDSILCVIQRRAISEELCQLAETHYMAVGKTISTNRGHAAGAASRDRTNANYERGRAANTGILGYMDAANSKYPCRLTQFCRKHFEAYQSGLPFVARMNDLFQTSVPDRYEIQQTAIKQAVDEEGNAFAIGDTAFSTITVNYNFQTALHKDSGDFREGFGTLAIVSKNVSGGWLCFPQYRLAVQLNRGDFVAMDVHEWHCNTPILPHANSEGHRLAFVGYFRERLLQCRDINRRLALAKLSAATHDTDKLIRDIFGTQTDLPRIPMSDPKWWTIDTDEYHLEYKWKRYILYDKMNQKIVRNLWPAWEYVCQKRI